MASEHWIERLSQMRDINGDCVERRLLGCQFWLRGVMASDENKECLNIRHDLSILLESSQGEGVQFQFQVD
jgi:hypothetical protein